MSDPLQILKQLADCVLENRYQSLETNWLEVKAVPPTGAQWDQVSVSVMSFLNSNGGTIILGIKEEQKPHRRFVHSGYDESQSGPLSNLLRSFTDKTGNLLDLREYIALHIEPFLQGQVAMISVNPLPDDKKFAFYKHEARERVLDGDKLIPKERIEEQEERKRELEYARELKVVPEATLQDLSLHRLNEYILLLNRGSQSPIETIKGTLEDALPFLERKRFILKNGEVTTLGLLVCGNQPDNLLRFRAQLDAFVDVPAVVAQDKKTFRDNVTQLMEAGIGWTLRNIHTGISLQAGGTATAEYPEKLVRESINNALAHRDYAIDRPVQLTLKPRISLAIRNPGHFPPELVFESADHDRPVRRIFANPRARNPRLADVLKVYTKWEGRGVGIADLTNFALHNEIDVPYYQFHSADELSLIIPSGKVLDDAMREWLGLFDRFLAEKSGGAAWTEEQRTVLAYIIKSEKANRLGRFTIALTPDNNHFGAIAAMEAWDVVKPHPNSERFHRVYVATAELVDDNPSMQLRELLGAAFDDDVALVQEILKMVWLAGRYSQSGGLNAKQVYRLLRDRMPEELQKRGEDEFYRAVRYRMERMAPDKKKHSLNDVTGWIDQPDRVLGLHGPASKPLFRINPGFRKGLL